MSANAVPVRSSAEFFREHGAFVWRLLRRLGVPRADLDDLTQEVFLAVHRALSTYEERNQLKAWLYRIAVREAGRHRRSRPPPSSMDIEDLDQTSPDCPEAIAQANETRARFDRLLATLDEPRRTVFVLYEIEELTMAEVAAAVGCPLQTAYSRHNSAKKQILTAARRLEANEGAR
jgi:RNA polymerase sigma-70 factor, ECF subfamily